MRTLSSHWYDQIDFNKRIQVTDKRRPLVFRVFLWLHTPSLLYHWTFTDWYNLLPRKAPSCYRLGYYLRSYFLYWSFSYSSSHLSQREELISIYHMWHFPWRGDNGRGRYKRTLHITILCLFCERLEPHLDPEALDFNFNLSIFPSDLSLLPQKRPCSVWHFCSLKSTRFLDF